MTEQTGTLMTQRGAVLRTRAELCLLPVPEGTATHQPLSHAAVVEALIESLGFRHISVVRDEYAVSTDGMKMFGVLDLDYEFSGVRFSIGIRNANDKSMRLAMTVGYRVFVCDNMAFNGDFTPVTAKHSKRLNLIDVISVGVDKIQRNFEPLQRTITDWRGVELADNAARLIIYEAFVEGKLDFPRHLLGSVHEHYFEPKYPEFEDRTLWSLSNAFTSSFKDLAPIQQFKATAKLNPFLERHHRPF